MEENTDIEKNNIDDTLREAVTNELSRYTSSPSSMRPNVATPKDFGEKIAPKIPTILAKNENQPKKKASRPVIRTYKSDMEETINTGHLSSINIAVSENNRMMHRMGQDVDQVKKSTTHKNIVIISMILILGGALAIFIPYLLVNKQSTQTQTANSVSDQAIMTTDLEETINLSEINQNGIDTTLNNRVNESSTVLGQVKDFVLTEGSGTEEQAIGAGEFLSLIHANVPAEISRNLLPQYMFGMYNYNGDQEFLILKVNSYDTTFSGMLSWEADLWQNFKNLFGLPDIAAITASANTATSSAAATTTQTSENVSNGAGVGIEVATFQDAEFDNEDCRVVKDANGNIIFLYSIIDQNTVVIATSPATLEEIISRIHSVNTVTQ